LLEIEAAAAALWRVVIELLLGRKNDELVVILGLDVDVVVDCCAAAADC